MSTDPFPLRASPRDAPARASGEAPARDPAVPTLDSQALLQGRGSVSIRHHGVVYRLQATRLGKLILTK